MSKKQEHQTGKSRMLCTALAVAVMLSSLFTGCGASSKGTLSTNAMASDSTAAMGEKVEAPMAAEGAVEESSALTSNQVLAEKNVKLIWYADVTMETLNFDELTGKMDETIAQYEGYVESSSVRGGARLEGGRDQRYAEYTIRIPHERLDEFLEQAGTLGNVTYQSLRSENVTLEYADNEARKATLELEEKKLMELLEQATELADIIQLESRLSEIHYQLDALSSTLRKYDNLVDYSTVYLNVREVNKMTESPQTLGERITSGFADSLYQLKIWGEDAVVFITARSPILLLLAVVIVLVVLLLKKVNRGHQKRVETYNEKRRLAEQMDSNKQDSGEKTKEDKK